jgi:hypothetical protein
MTPRRRRRALGFEPALTKVIVVDPNRPEDPPRSVRVDLPTLRRNSLRKLEPTQQPGADDGETWWGVGLR